MTLYIVDPITGDLHWVGYSQYYPVPSIGQKVVYKSVARVVENVTYSYETSNIYIYIK